jgi:hypothetical protein
MSTLVAQTISNGTVSTSSANVIQGSARAWVNFLGGATPTISNSYNVSSVTYSSTGTWVVNFTNALTDANFLTVCNPFFATYSGAWGSDLTNGRPINSSSAELNNVVSSNGASRNLGSGNIQAIFYR